MSFAFDSELEPSEEGLAEESLGDEYGGYFDDMDYLALGLDPSRPTDAKPGSEDKVLMLAARYTAGLPLWHAEDRYDHGPGQLDLVEPVVRSDADPFEDEEAV